MPRRRTATRPQNYDAADGRDAGRVRPRDHAAAEPAGRRAGGAAAAKGAAATIGMLPIARRDTERLRQILVAATPLARSGIVAAGETRADAPRAVPGSADLARDSRPRAGGARALAGIHRGARMRCPPRTKPEGGADVATAGARRRRRRGRRRGGRASIEMRRDVDNHGVPWSPRYPFFLSNSCMNSTSASTPSSGNAL